MPPLRVTTQLPPAPDTLTVPVGVPAPPPTVAVTVVDWPRLIVEGVTLTLTVGVALLTVNVVTPELAE